jgi:photosystem II stability/assembly factor-like uncharacterized protein
MKQLLLLAAFCCCCATTRAQWIQQNAGFTNNNLGFYEISIVDQNTVWAICYDGIGGLFGSRHILDFTRTTNGGTTWTAGRMGTDTSLAFSNISALSGTEAWVAMHKFDQSTGGGLFHTVDGGTTWTRSTNAFDTASWPNFVYFKDPLHGVAGGDANGGYFEIYTTGDGGTTWTRTPQANMPAYPANGGYGWFDGYAVVGDTLWFGTSASQIYKSIDFGKTWTASTVSSTIYNVNEIAFSDDGRHGVAHLRASNTVLFSTADGGATWTKQPAHPKWKPSRITSVPGTNMFVSTSMVGGATGSAYTTDNGQTWIEIEGTAAKAATRFLNKRVGWAGGFFNDTRSGVPSGGMFKWDSSMALSIRKEPGVGPMPTVYPNPAGRVLHIEGLTAATDGDYSLYDVTGALVKSFRVAAPSAAVDIAELPDGIYLLRAKNDAGVQLRFVKQAE